MKKSIISLVLTFCLIIQSTSLYSFQSWLDSPEKQRPYNAASDQELEALMKARNETVRVESSAIPALSAVPDGRSDPPAQPNAGALDIPADPPADVPEGETEPDVSDGPTDIPADPAAPIEENIPQESSPSPINFYASISVFNGPFGYVKTMNYAASMPGTGSGVMSISYYDTWYSFTEYTLQLSGDSAGTLSVMHWRPGAQQSVFTPADGQTYFDALSAMLSTAEEGKNYATYSQDIVETAIWMADFYKYINDHPWETTLDGLSLTVRVNGFAEFNLRDGQVLRGAYDFGTRTATFKNAIDATHRTEYQVHLDETRHIDSVTYQIEDDASPTAIKIIEGTEYDWTGELIKTTRHTFHPAGFSEFSETFYWIVAQMRKPVTHIMTTYGIMAVNGTVIFTTTKIRKTFYGYDEAGDQYAEAGILEDYNANHLNYYHVHSAAGTDIIFEDYNFTSGPNENTLLDRVNSLEDAYLIDEDYQIRTGIEGPRQELLRATQSEMDKTDARLAELNKLLSDVNAARAAVTALNAQLEAWLPSTALRIATRAGILKIINDVSIFLNSAGTGNLPSQLNQINALINQHMARASLLRAYEVQVRGAKTRAELDVLRAQFPDPPFFPSTPDPLAKLNDLISQGTTLRGYASYDLVELTREIQNVQSSISNVLNGLTALPATVDFADISVWDAKLDPAFNAIRDILTQFKILLKNENYISDTLLAPPEVQLVEMNAAQTLSLYYFGLMRRPVRLTNFMGINGNDLTVPVLELMVALNGELQAVGLSREAREADYLLLKGLNAQFIGQFHPGEGAYNFNILSPMNSVTAYPGASERNLRNLILGFVRSPQYAAIFNANGSASKDLFRVLLRGGADDLAKEIKKSYPANSVVLITNLHIKSALSNTLDLEIDYTVNGAAKPQASAKVTLGQTFNINSLILDDIGGDPTLDQEAVLHFGDSFGYSHPNFTGSAGTLTMDQFRQAYGAMMHNPNSFRAWLQYGVDPRNLNPDGVYAKHISIRTIDESYDEIVDHPSWDYITQKHPEWIVRDANGNSISLFLPTEVVLDYENPEYLDWLVNNWAPIPNASQANDPKNMGYTHFFDSTDNDPNKTTWYVQDNGNLWRMYNNCGANNPVCDKYNTDKGVQDAWISFFDAFNARWPNKKILLSSGPWTYGKSTEEMMTAFKNVLPHTAGYFSEILTNDFAYWNNQPNSEKRKALRTTMELAHWLAENDKVFFPNLGMGTNLDPTQKQIDYGYAFFNLMREGDLQFFSVSTKPNGAWEPRGLPEMDPALALGLAQEKATPIAVAGSAQINPDVYRREFENAIAYVNMSDNQVTINLPPGHVYKNSRGEIVTSPIRIDSFSGMTLYKA